MSTNNQIRKLRSDVEKLKSDQKATQNDVALIKERNICDDLRKERYPGSGKALLSYKEIAENNHVSDATVARTAEKNNLSRRDKKSNEAI